MPAAAARSSARAPARFDATAAIGRPCVDQRLQVRPLAADEDADHATTSADHESAVARVGDDGEKPIPRLKTRRSSSSSTWRASQPKTGGRSHASQSSSARRPVRADALEVARDPAAGHVRERVRRSSRSARTSSR